jgi:hypothetical protein
MRQEVGSNRLLARQLKIVKLPQAPNEHPLDVTVQCLHDANPRKHRRAAVAFGDQDQDFNGSLPFLDLLFGLR